MKERVMIGFGVFALIVVLLFVGNNFDVEEEVASVPVVVEVPDSVPAAVPSVPAKINFESYNIDYMNDDVKAILVRQLGASGKTAFYLPSTGYVNVSLGTKYGVAFVIQNVNPKVPEGSRFAYNFDASFEDCGVDLDVAQSWIESGWSSQGMIAGQWREDWNEWHDAMTIRFAFPDDVEACNVKYNFVITKDGAAYDSRVLEFNLV